MLLKNITIFHIMAYFWLKNCGPEPLIRTPKIAFYFKEFCLFKSTEKFLRRRLVLLALLMLIGLCNAPQYALAKQCVSPPDKINLLFDFNWPDASIVALTKKLSLQCGEPENYMPLMHAIKLHLMNDGIDVANVVLQKDEDDAIPQI